MIEYLNLQTLNARYSKEIDEAIMRVAHSGWYLQGKESISFEENYAAYIGTKYCVSCGNGLDALRIIFRAYIELGLLHEGDEIIVPANTYIASILSITENRLKAILVEPKYETLEIDEDEIESHISERTKGIMIVHLYGRCAYTEKIRLLCKTNNLLLIEDNAQAHGCCFSDGRRTGSLGNAAGHSFYPGKNLGAIGDAGAITTNDENLARTVRALANYGSSKKYIFDYCGYNSRIDEMQAAVLNVKLKHLNNDNALRSLIAEYYYKHIHWSATLLHPKPSKTRGNVFHIFPILTTLRYDLQDYLYSEGIQTLIHYPIPPHKQKCYHEWENYSLPITEKIHTRELSLPISPYLTKEDCKKIVDSINMFFDKNHS